MSLSLKLPLRNPDAPRLSLRERYAALKGSAAKVMGRKSAGVTRPPLAGAGKPSAALAALLTAHEMAYGYALYAEAYGMPDLAERRQAEEEAFRTLLHSPLTSDADRAAYAAAVISRQGNSLGDDSAAERDHPMAVAFRNITFGEHAREAEAMRHVGRPAEPEAVPDPILAAIEAHRAAHAVWHPLMCIWNDTHGGTPEYEAARAADAAARQIEREAFRALLATRPTTVAGCLTFTAYLSSAVIDNDHQLDEDTAEVLRALRDGATAWGEAPIGEPASAPAALDFGERAKLSAEQIELSALDVRSLAHLYEAFQVARYSWEGVGSRPYCDRGQLGDIPEFEDQRAAFMLGRIANEIASRAPSADEQRDEILMSRVSYEMMCNGRIHDNALLADIASAWTV